MNQAVKCSSGWQAGQIPVPGSRARCFLARARTALMVPIAAVLVLPLDAQVPQARVGKGWNFPLYEGTELKALLTGETADRLPGGVVQLQQFRMKTFRDGDTDRVELIVEAPETLFHPGRRIAWSDGPLKVFTANTNYFIEGRGFDFQQTNMTLTISNEVRTLITSTNSAGGPNPPIQIHSDFFRIETRESSGEEVTEALYTGNVHVIDPELELTCGRLIVELPSGQERPRQIVASEQVSVLNKRDNSRTTGERAVYTSKDGRELVTLFGNPVWRDETRESRADMFVFDREEKVVRAEGNAFMKLPRESLTQPALLLADAPAPDPDEAAGQMVEVFANVITIQLPAEDEAPIREITAEGNVRIISEGGESRAASSRAVYTEATGRLVLTGDPVWELRDSVLRAGMLILGGDEQGLRAGGSVFLRMRAGPLTAGQAGKEASENETIRFIEIVSDSLEYEAERAIFRDNARARLLEAEVEHGVLEAQLLTVHFTGGNEIATVIAERDVRVVQQVEFPGSNESPARTVEKLLTCDVLTTERSPETRLLETIVAEGNVFGEEVERAGERTVHKTFVAELARIEFAEGTNRVERLTAERGVHLEQVERSGEEENSSGVSGDLLVYGAGGGRERVEVTGNPVAETAGAVIRDSRTLVWDLMSGKISARGPFRVTPVAPRETARAPGG